MLGNASQAPRLRVRRPFTATPPGRGGQARRGEVRVFQHGSQRYGGEGKTAPHRLRTLAGNSESPPLVHLRKPSIFFSQASREIGRYRRGSGIGRNSRGGWVGVSELRCSQRARPRTARPLSRAQTKTFSPATRPAGSHLPLAKKFPRQSTRRKCDAIPDRAPRARSIACPPGTARQ